MSANVFSSGRLLITIYEQPSHGLPHSTSAWKSVRQNDRSNRSGRSARPVNPPISAAGQGALDQYAEYLRNEEDLSPSTVRNYLSDLRQFAAWCEATWEEGQEAGQTFTPVVATWPIHAHAARL